MYPFVIHLDRMMRVIGTYDANADETSWTLPVADDSLDTIVLSNTFGDNAGETLEPDTNSAGTVTKSGDWSNGEVVIGRSFTQSIELSRVYVRDRNDRADTDAWVQIRETVASFQDTQGLMIRSRMPRRQDRITRLMGERIRDRDELNAWHNGNASDMRQFLEQSTAKPCTITAVEYMVDYAPRLGEPTR